MGDLWRSASTPRSEIAKDRVGAVRGQSLALIGGLVARQYGRVGRWQLERLGVGSAMIGRWVAQAYLHRVLPGVYAVGHLAPSAEGDLAAALLYAGPGAMLSHASAAWWYRLLEGRPGTIQISAPRRCRSLPGVTVHGRRELPRVWRHRLPVTTAAQALLDLAAAAPLETTRYALANAEYHHLFDQRAITALLGHGRPGSAALRKAIRTHEPRLGLTKSKLERDLITLCERYRIPLPEVNVRVEGLTVDAVWREQRLVVELDGYDNHSTPAQIERDRRRDLRLRAAGYTVVRYSWDQINNQPSLVAADIERLLSSPAPSDGPGSR